MKIRALRIDSPTHALYHKMQPRKRGPTTCLAVDFSCRPCYTFRFTAVGSAMNFGGQVPQPHEVTGHRPSRSIGGRSATGKMLSSSGSLISGPMKIEQLRTRIDEIDRRIVSLLNRRAQMAMKVGEIKHRNGAPIFAPEREEQVLRRAEAYTAAVRRDRAGDDARDLLRDHLRVPLGRAAAQRGLPRAARHVQPSRGEVGALDDPRRQRGETAVRLVRGPAAGERDRGGLRGGRHRPRRLRRGADREHLRGRHRRDAGHVHGVGPEGQRRNPGAGASRPAGAVRAAARSAGFTARPRCSDNARAGWRAITRRRR